MIEKLFSPQGLRFADVMPEPQQLTLISLAAGVILVVLLIWTLLANASARRATEAAHREAAQLAEEARREAERVAFQHILETQIGELKGRIQTLAEVSLNRQGEVTSAVNERLDRISVRLGQNLDENQKRTFDHLSQLHERLAVIDSAQRTITDLSTKVVSLQDILANKQSRGAFGQMRMETIIEDGLPKGAYSFQPTLSNGKRPDCVIHLPNASAGIVVDAKFPLEGFEALRVAHQPEARKQAEKQIRVDLGRHIDDIAGKYLIAGETQDNCLMFVPSESISADLHEHFPDLIQRAHRARVVIVSPSMLMLAVQTMQAVMKDVAMREQAGLIQREVSLLVDDVLRLHERVLDLQRHFGLASKDLEKIVTSSDKISQRGRRIENLDLEPVPAAGAASLLIEREADPAPLAATEGTKPAPDRRKSGDAITRPAAARSLAARS